MRVGGGLELRHEGVVAAIGGGVEGPRGSGKVRGRRVAGEVRVAARVERDPVTDVGARPAQVAGVGKRRAGGIELRQEDVAGAVVGGVEPALGSREERGVGAAGDVGAPASVHQDPRA